MLTDPVLNSQNVLVVLDAVEHPNQGDGSVENAHEDIESVTLFRGHT